MEIIYLDTHVLVRLYLGDADKLSPGAREALETNEILASPAAVLELEFLHEIGRLQPNASKVTLTLAETVGLRICELSFRTVVEYALKEKWGRDPFDRLIVAHARAQDAPLVTKDERIRRHYRRTVW